VIVASRRLTAACKRGAVSVTAELSEDCVNFTAGQLVRLTT
jgi:hypothetical protein